jgi:hypothetical protein
VLSARSWASNSDLRGEPSGPSCSPATWPEHLRKAWMLLTYTAENPSSCDEMGGKPGTRPGSAWWPSTWPGRPRWSYLQFEAELSASAGVPGLHVTCFTRLTVEKIHTAALIAAPRRPPLPTESTHVNDQERYS